MNLLAHVAARLFGAPLLIHRPKLDVILAVLGSRVGIADLATPVAYTAIERSATNTHAKIAVIPIHGTLVRRTAGLEAESGLMSYTAIASLLDVAVQNPKVSAILLDIDSPGGESGGVFDLADHIRSLSSIKPIWAVANDMAFSAAYALASAATHITVSRTGGVGSIGVIAMHVDQSLKDIQDGIRYTAVFAGQRKNDLNPHEPISDQAQAVLHGEVNRIYRLFVETVAKHRNLTASAIQASEAGLFFGQDAIDAGLADAIGSFDDALLQLSQSVSTIPKLASNQSGSLSHQHLLSMEFPMDDQAQRSAPSVTNATHQSTDLTDSLAHAGTAAPSMADAIEIAQTCTLAGRTDLIAGFLETSTSPTKVRSALLRNQAERSPEIISRIAPHNTTSASSILANNPLIDAAKQLAAQSASLKKDS